MGPYRKSRVNRTLVIFLAVSVLLVCATASYAAPITLILTTTTALTNVTDGAGLWQFDGGTVSLSGVIGNFARVKRTVTGATSPQNTAMLTITIFFLGSDPPESVTLQGTHSFTNGQERGSISGTSRALEGAEGTTFQGPSTALTFNVP